MIAGICMVKDEADVIGHTLRHMLTQVDCVFLADNGSTDGTTEILREIESEATFENGLRFITDSDPAYYQSAKMTALADWASGEGATWVVPFDADEKWYSPSGRIGDVLSGLEGAAIATAELYDHVATGADKVSGEGPFIDMCWRRREAAPLPKVAARTRPAVTIEQGNHGANYGATVAGQLIVRHFPYRSVEQFVHKVRNGATAYAATDLPEDVGKHWRDYGRLLEQGGEDAIREVFESWFFEADPYKDPGLIFDPAP